MKLSLRVVACSLLFQAWAQDHRSTSPFTNLLAKWSEGKRPGVAVALIEDGRLKYKATLGYADLQRGVLVRSDTRFLVGSISKQFTATAILLLAEDGKLQLDDAASHFVPELPPFARNITIRQLLHHTGGLPDHEELLTGKIGPDFFLNAARSRPAPFTASQALVALQQSSGLRFTPGERWEYSNTGYMVLGQVIERVCGCSYAEFLARRIFTPLQMKESLVIPFPPAKVARLSTAYAWQQGEWKDISYSPLNFIPGHDGVVSTVGDMALWAAAIGSGKILPRAANASMWQSGSTEDGKPTQYGYGWRISDLNGHGIFEHEGCWSGFRNGIVRSSDGRLTVVVLTNGTDTEEFWNCREGLSLARSVIERAMAHRD